MASAEKCRRGVRVVGGAAALAFLLGGLAPAAEAQGPSHPSKLSVTPLGGFHSSLDVPVEFSGTQVWGDGTVHDRQELRAQSWGWGPQAGLELSFGIRGLRAFAVYEGGKLGRNPGAVVAPDSAGSRPGDFPAPLRAWQGTSHLIGVGLGARFRVPRVVPMLEIGVAPSRLLLSTLPAGFLGGGPYTSGSPPPAPRNTTVLRTTAGVAYPLRPWLVARGGGELWRLFWSDAAIERDFAALSPIQNTTSVTTHPSSCWSLIAGLEIHRP